MMCFKILLAKWAGRKGASFVVSAFSGRINLKARESVAIFFVQGETDMIRNPLYQIAEIRRYARKIGWPAAIRLRSRDVKVRTGLGAPSSVELKLKNAEHPILMRTYSSDREVLRQIFIEDDYDPIVLSSPRMILDLGANVGYSSAYFLSKYPSANVLAVEPDPSNYAICCRNLEPFGRRVRVILGAAWPECTNLVLHKGTYRDGREWATQVRSATETDTSATSAYVNAYDIATLIGLSDVAEIDLLKIDIERSELELFSRNTENGLPRVRNLCIELHDPDCEVAVFRALSAYSYSLSRSGDLTVCGNLHIRG
jgi:FkbM family methyltransferase